MTVISVYTPQSDLDDSQRDSTMVLSMFSQSQGWHCRRSRRRQWSSWKWCRRIWGQALRLWFCYWEWESGKDSRVLRRYEYGNRKYTLAPSKIQENYYFIRRDEMKFLKDMKAIPSDHYIQQGTRIKSVPMGKMETIEDSVKMILAHISIKKRRSS